MNFYSYSLTIILTLTCCFWNTQATSRPVGFGQKVSADPEAEDFSNILQQPSAGLEPPNYGQVVDAAPTQAITHKGSFIGQPQTVDGTEVIAFLGVPYAKPPVGKLRFKRPIPADNLQEPLHTTRFPNACTQVVYQSSKFYIHKNKSFFKVKSFVIFLCIAI
jgi:hypothetical protein